MTARRDQILRAALDIADEHGLAAVSMRTVAERVGVSAMALYPHVAGKDALLDGLVDVMLAELLPLLDDSRGADPWTRLVGIGTAMRQVARRHRSAFALLLARPTVTRDAVRVTDAVQRALLDIGVPEAQVPRLERMLGTFVLGFAASEVNGRFGLSSLDLRPPRAHLAEGGLPAMRRLAGHEEQPVDWDAEFAADLDDLRLLIEAIAKR